MSVPGLKVQRQRGGDFLLRPVDPSAVLVPEGLSADQREVQRGIARTTAQFVERELAPAREALEEHNWELSRRLIRRMGELGLLGIEVPEAYGGVGEDKLTAVPVQIEVAPMSSFSITYGVQTGIGMWPLLYFGTPEQKQKYLPGLTSGEKLAAYSLTEPTSGSDALSARTTARLSADGTHYILNGTKQWTTNANMADLFTVFAKIDGQHFTAFLVERGFPGVSTGPEEDKMGLRGSSTAQVILSDARVPVENVLHYPGKGHQVALNTLNLGRFKLAIGCLGAAIGLIGVCARYAQERQQFGRPLALFRLIQQKLAGMATLVYGLQSATYRLTGLLDASLAGLDLTGDLRDSIPVVLGEYAIECSILKVLGSEILFEVADEGVQIHGGNGFMRGYDVERAYRDNRINRIFEGTNEINRLLIPDMLFRRARRGELPGLTSGASFRPESSTSELVAADDARIVDAARGLFWLVAGAAARTDPKQRDEEQEVAAVLGDIAIDLFAVESALIRAARAQTGEPPERAQLHRDLGRAFAAIALDRIVTRARHALAYLAPDDQAGSPVEQAGLLTRVDQITPGRRIAALVLDARAWPLPIA